MRVALAISVAVHAVLWGLAGWLAHVPAAGPGMAAMEIELVRADEAKPAEPPETQAAPEPDKTEPDKTAAEAPAAEKPVAETAKAETAQPEKSVAETAPEKPARSETPPSSQAAVPPDLPRPDQPLPSTPPQLAAVDPATAAASPQAEPPADGGGTWFDSPLMNVAVGYQTTDRKAKLTDREIAAFKARLASCWRPSPALADAPARLAVVLRVALRPDGSLAGDPSLLAASASPKGAVLLQTAMAALRSCPPVGLLPAAKYKEWRLLDLAFAPSGLTGLPKL